MGRTRTMAAFVSNLRNIWSSYEQGRQIFNWKSILEEWNQSLNLHPYVQTVIDNLKIASDPNEDRDFPLAHFKKFLNYERDGLTWFLYEVVTMRYMFGGETRLDYVADLVASDAIVLDEGFPTFPGSPKNHRTVRQFLNENLSEDEREFVDMMPALVPPSLSVTNPSSPLSTPSTPSTPYRPIRSASSEEATRAPIIVRHRPLIVERSADADDAFPSYPYIELRVIPENHKKDKDHIIHIKKQQKLFEEHYTVSYKDGLDGLSTVTKNMTRSQVLHYLSTTFRLLSVDTAPEQHIQLSLPNAPTVFLPIKNDSYTRDLVYDAVEGMMDNWSIRC